MVCESWKSQTNPSREGKTDLEAETPAHEDLGDDKEREWPARAHARVANRLEQRAENNDNAEAETVGEVDIGRARDDIAAKVGHVYHGDWRVSWVWMSGRSDGLSR